MKMCLQTLGECFFPPPPLLKQILILQKVCLLDVAQTDWTGCYPDYNFPQRATSRSSHDFRFFFNMTQGCVESQEMQFIQTTGKLTMRHPTHKLLLNPDAAHNSKFSEFGYVCHPKSFSEKQLSSNNFPILITFASQFPNSFSQSQSPVVCFSNRTEKNCKCSLHYMQYKYRPKKTIYV